MSDKKELFDEFLTNPEFVRWVRNPDRELEAYWLKWMDANPDKRKDLKLAREIVQGFSFEEKLPDQHLRQTVLSNILNNEGNTVPVDKEPHPSVKPIIPFWNILGQMSRVAAILTLAVAVSFTAAYLDRTTPRTEPVDMVNTVTKTTAYGEKLHFKLPDGSLVWLNAGSELQYPEKFDSLARMVHLQGEAFFKVEGEQERPFSVVSNDLITTALGTSFNIKNDGTDVLSISLISGKVKVENDLTHENILLLPGQQLEYSEETKKTFVGSFEEDWVIGWKSGLLRFDHAEFLEVIEELEKWYGVTINVTGKPTRKWNLTGEYHNQNLELVLKRISYIEQFEFSIDGKNVQIEF